MGELISIVVPVYNVERYLKECIESVLEQDYQDFQLILVDDGSTDKSGAICDMYADKYDKVTVVHQKNKGVSAARNKGVALSKGQWILFLDADDWIEKNTCDILSQKLSTDYDVYFFPYFKYEKTKRFIVTSPHKHDELERSDFDIFQEWLLNQYIYGNDYAISSPWAKIYRTDFIRKNNIFFNPKLAMGEDKVFNFQVYQFACKGMYIDIPFYNYRINTNSSSRKYDKNIIEKYENLLQEISIFIEKYRKGDKLTEAFNIRKAMALMYYIVLFLCNRDNTMNYSKRKKIFQTIRNKPLYNEALKKIKFCVFPFTQSILFLFLKKKNFFALDILSKLYIFLKK